MARKVIHEHQTFSFMRLAFATPYAWRRGAAQRCGFRCSLEMLMLCSCNPLITMLWEACVYLRLAKLRESQQPRLASSTAYEGSSKATQKRIRHMLTLPDTIVVQSEECCHFSTITDVNKPTSCPMVPPPPPIPQRAAASECVRCLDATSEATQGCRDGRRPHQG